MLEHLGTSSPMKLKQQKIYFSTSLATFNPFINSVIKSDFHKYSWGTCLHEKKRELYNQSLKISDNEAYKSSTT